MLTWVGVQVFLSCQEQIQLAKTVIKKKKTPTKIEVLLLLARRAVENITLLELIHVSLL